MLPGKLYELAIFTNTLINNPETPFDIGQEIRIGDKFDDLVVRVNDGQYTFVQIKLVDDSEHNVIDSNVLLGERKISLNKDDFKLQKYFLSFLRIRDQLNSKNNGSSIEKLIIFTNAHLNHSEVNLEVGAITVIRHISDNILNTNENLESYKIINPNNVFIQKIRNNLKCDLQILAEEIAKYITDGNSNPDPMVLDVDCFRYYHTALIDENVIEVGEYQHGNKKLKLGKFTSNFIHQIQLSNRAQKLRAEILKIILRKQLKLQELLDNMTKAEWKVSDDFGSTDSKDAIFLPNYEISDKDVQDFFGVLELRVNQHGVKDVLKKIKNVQIKNRFLEYFDTDPKLVEFLINDFIQEWRNEETTQERWLLNSKRSDFIKDLEIKIAKPQAMHTTHKHVKYIESIIKRYDLHYRDDCLFNDKYFLEGKREKYFVISTASNILTSIKMLQYLKKKKQKNFLFIDLENLPAKREIIKLIDAFRDIKYSLLILSYKFLIENDIVNELVSKLSKVTIEYSSKKVIFITQTADSLVKNIDCYKEYKDKSIGIEHLVDSIKILQQEITIQGQTIQVGNFHSQIDFNIMEKLITDKIDIGSNTTEMKYLEGAYTELLEEVNMESFVNEILLRKANNVYIINGIPVSWKADRLFEVMGITENSTLNIMKSRIEILEKDNVNILSNRIYVSSDQFRERQFKEICKNNPEIKIYFIDLKSVDSKFTLILSRMYNPEFYIKGRKFNNKVILKKNIKELLGKSDLRERFFICGIKIRDMETWLELENDIKENFRANYLSKKIEFLSSREDLNVISPKLDKENIEESRHLLKFEKGQLIWCNTYGSLGDLNKYRAESYKNTQHLLGESDIIKEIKDKKVVIISGDPGIGKSTALVKIIDYKYKSQSGIDESIIMSHWVIKIILKDHLQLIKNIVVNDGSCSSQILITKIVEFLSQVQKSLNDDAAKSLLRLALIEKQFRKPLLIAFDGFDEILDEEDRNKVILLINQLKDNTMVKVWITTRMHYEKILENKLSTFAIRLEAMDTEKVRIYIKKYLKEHLRLILRREEFTNIFDNNDALENTGVLHEYTDAFLNKIQEIFKSDVSWFIGTPLQLYLTLEESAKYFKKWLKNRSGEKPDFSYLGNNIWEVYEKFTDRKYDTYLKKREVKERLKQKLEITVFDRFYTSLVKSFLLESDVKKPLKGLKDVILLAGVVRSDGTNIEFIHPTFQEYFAAKLFIYWIEKWSRERQSKLTNLLKKKYLIEEILSKSSYQVIRVFLNTKLLDEKFESANLQEDYYNEQILLLAIKENNEGIASFLLNNFQNADVDHTAQHGLHNSPLKTAAHCGNLEMLKLLLKYSADIEKLGKLSSSLLHDAANSGNLDMAKYLVKNGADINHRDDFCETVLHAAVSQPNNIEMVKFFVQNGVDVNAINCSGIFVIHRAVSRPGNVEIVEYLIQNGAFIIGDDDGFDAITYTAISKLEDGVADFLLKEENEHYDNTGRICLDIAVRNCDLAVVKLLIHRGVVINDPDNKKNKVIFTAVTQPGNLEVVRFLVQNGANVNDVDVYGETVICKAVSQSDNLEIVKYLVEKDADLNHKNKLEETIMHKAVAHCGNFAIVNFLIEIGVNIHTRNCNDETPLSFAVESGDLEIVKCLVQKGADFNAINCKGESIICKALARRDNIEVVEYLLKIGADVNTIDSHEVTNIFDAIVRLGNLDLITFLIKNDVDVCSRNKKRKIMLNIAVENNNLEIVKGLLQDGESVNAKEFIGDTIISNAVSRGNIEMVQFLVQSGANVHSRSKDGSTALSIAVRKDDMKMVKLLIENGLKSDDRIEDDVRIVIINNNVEMLKLLIKLSTHINYLCEHYSMLLHDATENGSLEIIKYLIENGADINAKDKTGKPAIYKAVGYVHLNGIIQLRQRTLVEGSEMDFETFDALLKDVENFQSEIVEYFLQRGAKFDVRTKDSKLVLKRAADCNNLKIVKLLMDYSASNGHVDELCLSIFHSALELHNNLEVVKFLVETYWSDPFS